MQRLPQSNGRAVKGKVRRLRAFELELSYIRNTLKLKLLIPLWHKLQSREDEEVQQLGIEGRCWPFRACKNIAVRRPSLRQESGGVPLGIDEWHCSREEGVLGDMVASTLSSGSQGSCSWNVLSTDTDVDQKTAKG